MCNKNEKCFRSDSVKAESKWRIQVHTICWRCAPQNIRENVKKNWEEWDSWAGIGSQVKPSLGCVDRRATMEHKPYLEVIPVEGLGQPFATVHQAAIDWGLQVGLEIHCWRGSSFQQKTNLQRGSPYEIWQPIRWWKISSGGIMIYVLITLIQYLVVMRVECSV